MISQIEIFMAVKSRYGITDRNLAELLKCCKARVELLKTGKAEMTGGDIMRLCQGLNLTEKQMTEIL